MEESTSKAFAGPADLANPLIAPATGGGSALFVINLCASIAPVPISGKNLPGLDNYRLYQVSRVEDGRTRHRLRLGFFTNESHAQSVLAVVRQQYPSAFTTCLCDEDRKFARGYLPESAMAAAPPKPAMTVVKPTSAPAQQATPVAPAPTKPATAVETKAAPVPIAAKVPPPAATATKAAAAPVATKAPPAAPSKPAAAKPAAANTLTPAEPEFIELNWEPEPAAKAPPAAANAATTPTQSALSSIAGLDEMTWDPPSLLPAASAPGKSTSDTAKHPVLAAGFKTQPVIKAPPAPTKATTPVAATPQPAAVKPAPLKAAPAKVAPAAVDTAASMRVPALQLTLSDPPPPSPQQQAAASAEPFHVGKGVQIADLGISLQAEPVTAPAASETPAQAPVATAAKPALKNTPAAAKKPAAPAPSAATAQAPQAAKATPPMMPQVAAPVAAKPAIPAATAVPRPMLNLPELDSTQTIRALTSAELGDDKQEKWFAIQLAVSEQPVNLDTMPHLDIFEAYRLYSVASAGSGKIVHSLRLGFFKEAVSAEAVGGYLKTFFGSPTVLRVSVAEHARFKDPPTPKKAAAQSAVAKVVDLNDARAARPIPTVTMEVATPALDTSATGSFRPNASGSFKTSATGTHKTLKPAAKTAGATKRGAASSPKASATGKYKMPQIKKSLSEALIDEAREVALSESGVRKAPKNDSLFSRLVDKLTK